MTRAALSAIRDAIRSAREIPIDDWILVGERVFLFVLVLALAIVGVYLSAWGPR